ncbi:MAG TPA: hypothetical protein VNZ64_23320 [Candidatus Acidoferrum sp.]|nr:hypothetical protein [Candidatus Acidoferrum sp.]
MLYTLTLWLGLVAVLIAYLCVSVGRRWVAQEAKRRAEESQPPGTGFDASTIAPQIQRVRQDYLAGAQTRPHQTFYRAGLLALARRMVAGLPYFRHAHHDQEVQSHGG